MHAVAVDGPDDDKLWRLLMVIADFAQADGTGAVVGQREMSERVRAGNRALPKLIARAIREGWLAVDKPGSPRHATTYSIPVTSAHRVRSVRGSRSARGQHLVSVSAQTADTDVRRIYVRRASATRDASLASGKPLFLPGSGLLEDWTHHNNGNPTS